MMRCRRDPRRALNPLSRREAMALTGGVALAFPFLASAQPYAMPVVGLLDSAASGPDELAAFYDGLKAEGYLRNQTIETIYHSAAGDYGRLPALAVDLIKRQVAAFAAFGVPAALAAKNATAAIPVIFAIGPDPVEIGLVRSLDLPGGNITGVTALAAGRESKRLELLHQLISVAAEIAVLVNPANAIAGAQVRNATAAARAIGVRLRPIRVSVPDEFDTAFDSLAASPPGGLIIADDELFDSRAADLGFLTLRHRIPAIFQGRSFTAAGGLISYGSNLTEIYHQAGAYAGLVLKGASAVSLPIFQSGKIELIVNARSAASFGIAIPAAMQSAANEIIK